MTGASSLLRAALGLLTVVFLAGVNGDPPLTVNPIEPSRVDGYDYEFDENGVSFKWGKPSDLQGNVLMELIVKHTGWAGVGFCPRTRLPRGMNECDIVVVWVDNRGNTHVCDYYSVLSVPTRDATQNYFAISGKEEKGTTTVSFKRQYNTKDKDDVSFGNEVHIIWASNTVDMNGPCLSTELLAHSGGPTTFGSFNGNTTRMDDALVGAPVRPPKNGSGTSGLSGTLTLALSVWLILRRN